MAAKRSYKHTCPGCHLQFTSGSPRSVWCSKTCRNRVKREEARTAAEAEAATAAPEHPLVVRIRAELKAKGVAVDDVDGLLAVHLALGIASAETSGKVGPVAAFREARARALGLVEKPTLATTADDEPEPTGQDAQLGQILTMRDDTRAAIAAS